MTPWRVAWLSLWRRPFSSLLAMAAMALSVAVAGRLARVAESVHRQADELYAAPQALVSAKGDRLENYLAFQGLRPRTVEPLHGNLAKLLCHELNPVEGCVTGLVPATLGPHALVGLGEDFPAALKKLGLKLGQGNPPQKPWQALAGAATPFALSASVTPTLLATEQRSRQKPALTDILVSGRLAPTGTRLDSAVFLALADTQDMVFQMGVSGYFATDPPPEPVGFIWLWLAPGKSARDEVRLKVNAKTTAAFVDLEQARADFLDLTATGRLAATAASFLAVALVVMGNAALMMARFEGLTAQLAVLRAIGRRPMEVAAWVLMEGLCLTLCGAALGGLLELAISPGLGLAGFLKTDAQVVRGFFPFLALVWGLTAFSGALSGLPVLWRLYRMDVHEALRTL